MKCRIESCPYWRCGNCVWETTRKNCKHRRMVECLVDIANYHQLVEYYDIENGLKGLEFWTQIEYYQGYKDLYREELAKYQAGKY